MVNISIVSYSPDWCQILKLTDTLLQAETVKNIYLIDNSPEEAEIDTLNNLNKNRKIHYIWNEGKDIGFSRSHNIAIRESVWQRTKYHLVISHNIEIKAKDIDRLHYFMEHNPQVGQLLPRVADYNGQTLHLCRLLPTPFDVLKQYFLPVFIEEKRIKKNGLPASKYEQMMNVPVLNNQFMFLRTEAALKARLLDERFKTCIAHIDMTRIIHRDYLTLYIPDITIVQTSQESPDKQLFTKRKTIADWYRYFHKWGWILDSERKEINQLTLQLCMTR